jgi:dCMP deaminase
MKWDEYYLGICDAVSKKSKCHSRQIGAILVKDKIVISTGYNGPARDVPECRLRLYRDKNIEKELEKREITDSQIKAAYDAKMCPRKVMGFPSGEGLEWCNAVHSEKNCLLAAARMGISTKGAILYMNAEVSPCTQCYSACINAGIKEIVLIKNNIYDPSLEFCIEYAKLPIREFDI